MGERGYWAGVDERHKRRGGLVVELMIGDDALLNPPMRTGRRGRPRRYRDDLIEAGLTVRSLLHLPLRAVEGFIEAVLAAAGVLADIPDHTTLSRRMAKLDVPLQPFRPRPGEALVLAIDGTGLKVYGEGEWRVRQYGYSYRRTWRKMTLLIDTATGQILNVADSHSSVAEITHLPALLEGVDLAGAKLCGDGAYDTEGAYHLAWRAGAHLVAPPHRGAVAASTKPWGIARNQAVRYADHFGLAAWKRAAGYHRRSTVESAMHRFKRLTGASLMSRLPATQTVEVRLRAKALNSLLEPRA